MSARVSVVDRGLAKLREDLKTLRRLRVHGGVQAPESERPHTDSGTTIGTIAAVHEYGSSDGRIPARPFLRHTSEKFADAHRDRLRKAVSDVVDGRATPADALAEVGEGLMKDIVETINRASSWAKPLAASTVRAKGHNVPLIESYTLREAVTWSVVDGDSVIRRGGQ